MNTIEVYCEGGPLDMRVVRVWLLPDVPPEVTIDYDPCMPEWWTHTYPKCSLTPGWKRVTYVYDGDHYVIANQ